MNRGKARGVGRNVEAAEGLLARLREAGDEAAIIGRVVAGAPFLTVR